MCSGHHSEDPRYADQIHGLETAVVDGDGVLDRDVRRAAYARGEVPHDLAAYVDMVRTHAYKIGDRDTAALHSAGYSDDQVFELTIATALGEAKRRLDAGLRAMRGMA